MAAQPHIQPQQPQPRYTPQHANDDPYGDYPNPYADPYAPQQYGARSRKTIPMQPTQYDPYRDGELLFDERDIQVQVRRDCQYCGGHGTLHGRETVCQISTCRRHYSYETVKGCRHFGFAHRWVQFPCTHQIQERQIIWTRPQCSFCGGDGHEYIWIRWDQLLDALYAHGDEERRQETTEVLRALSKQQSGSTGQNHGQGDFARSGAPTAPPVSPTYQPPSHQHPQQVPVTPRFVTPLQPNDVSNNSF